MKIETQNNIVNLDEKVMVEMSRGELEVLLAIAGTTSESDATKKMENYKESGTATAVPINIDLYNIRKYLFQSFDNLSSVCRELKKEEKFKPINITVESFAELAVLACSVGSTSIADMKQSVLVSEGIVDKDDVVVEVSDKVYDALHLTASSLHKFSRKQ